jgi:hypothetical protein
MKRSNASVAPTPNRRSLIQHHHALLNDHEVVDFLNDAAPPVYTTLADKLVRANEPALLLELVQLSQHSVVNLLAIDDNDEPLPLPDGLLEYVLQHINQVPCMKELTVGEAVLSAATCAQLQTTLGATTCPLNSLVFINCSFADVHVQFPTNAATIESVEWNDELNGQGGPSPMDQMLPALAGWPRLAHLSLICDDDPVNFAVLTQMLLHNPCITSLYLVAEVASGAPGNLGHQPHHDPKLLLDLLAKDSIPLTSLIFQVRDTNNTTFNDHCLQNLTQCLMTNTTLESLEVPGIRVCTRAARRQFRTGLNANHGLLAVEPVSAFKGQVPAPVQRNQALRYWFTEGFVLGAAQAFMAMFNAPNDVGQQLAGHLSTTPIERIYCGAVMALICKSTHQNAVKLRSQGLKEAALIWIRNNEQKRCLELLNALVNHRMDLLPGDKQQVIDCAKEHNRPTFLPDGYAR